MMHSIDPEPDHPTAVEARAVRGEQIAAAMTIATALEQVIGRLIAAGITNAARDSLFLVSRAMGVSKEEAFAYPERVVSSTQLSIIHAAAERRAHGEPVSRIVGRREFWGLDFLISPAVLDPRPDTESVVEAALAVVKCEGWAGAPLRILDVGTGSGCIILSLLRELPLASGVGVDISQAAIGVASANAKNLALSNRVDFQARDFRHPIDGSFDIIVSNPPYIPSGDLARLARDVRNFDPLVSLDGGADGLDAYRCMMTHIAIGRPSGRWIVFEVGSDQFDAVSALAVDRGMSLGPDGIHAFADLSGIRRVVAAKARC